MDILTEMEVRVLLASKGPCLSIYLPTDRRGSEQDPIRWKNLVRRAEAELAGQGVAGAASRKLLAPTGRLVEDFAFWRQQSDGLACFLTAESARWYRLPFSFAEQVVAGERFHIKPLLPLLADNGRFYVLAISQKQVRLLQGSPFAAQEIDLKQAPKSLAEALRFDEKLEPLNYHSHPGPGRGWEAIFHGHGVGIDDHKNDLLRYFQMVDKGLRESLRESRAPLILASVDYLWPIYRQASKYPQLLEQGLAGNPDLLSGADLHRQAGAIVRPLFQKRQREAAALYGQLAGTGLAEGDVGEILRAAHAGKVETLFVARDRELWGRSDAEGFHVHDRRQAGDEDLLNLAACLLFLHKGTVFVVDADQVPGKGLLAAIHWRPTTRR